MRASRTSLLIFMIGVLFIGGMIGFQNSEGFSKADSFHATVAALTFSSNSNDYSGQGKLLNSLLSLTAVVIIIWAFVNLRSSVAPEFEGNVQDYFRFMPQDEDIILKEVKISSKSKLTGKSKLQVLEKTGSLVMAVKKGKEFKLNIPFERKLHGKTVVLAFGTPSQLKEFEQQTKK